MPLLVFLVSIFGLILQNDERRSELIDKIVDSLPLAQDAGIDLERILSNIPTPVSVAGLVSVVAFLWTASGAMAAIRTGVTAAFDDLPGRPFFASKFVDFLLVLAIGAIILVSFGLSIVVHAVERLSNEVADALGAAGFGVGGALGVIVPFALTFGAFTLLYHFVPPSRPRVRDVWVAGLVAALGFQAVNVGFSFYLATIATYNVLYGSLGSLFAASSPSSCARACCSSAPSWPFSGRGAASRTSPRPERTSPKRPARGTGGFSTPAAGSSSGGSAAGLEHERLSRRKDADLDLRHGLGGEPCEQVAGLREVGQVEVPEAERPQQPEVDGNRHPRPDQPEGLHGAVGVEVALAQPRPPAADREQRDVHPVRREVGHLRGRGRCRRRNTAGRCRPPRSRARLTAAEQASGRGSPGWPGSRRRRSRPTPRVGAR